MRQLILRTLQTGLPRPIVLVPRPRYLVLESPQVRFRLANLFYLTAVVAIVVFAWDLFIRENVAWTRPNEWGVSFGMTDDWYAWMGQPHFHDETGELIDPYNSLAISDAIMVTPPKHGVPWSAIALATFAIVAIDVGVHVLIRAVGRWRTRHENAPGG